MSTEADCVVWGKQMKKAMGRVERALQRVQLGNDAPLLIVRKNAAVEFDDPKIGDAFRAARFSEKEAQRSYGHKTKGSIWVKIVGDDPFANQAIFELFERCGRAAFSKTAPPQIWQWADPLIPQHSSSDFAWIIALGQFTEAGHGDLFYRSPKKEPLDIIVLPEGQTELTADEVQALYSDEIAVDHQRESHGVWSKWPQIFHQRINDPLERSADLLEFLIDLPPGNKEANQQKSAKTTAAPPLEANAGDENWLTLTEAKRWLGKSNLGTIDPLVKKGDLKDNGETGRSRRIDKISLVQYAEKHRINLYIGDPVD